MEGEWGTICDDSWGNIDAEVVCRQLGFPGIGAVALSFAHFGSGTGPIILDDVECVGLELYLTDCPNSGYFQHNCGHAEDAGVQCPSEFYEHRYRYICAMYMYMYVYQLKHVHV